MKKAILIFIIQFTIFVLNSNAQSPSWLWANSASGGSTDYSLGVATDAGGNVLVTGHFGSPSITFGTTVLTNVGSHDMFIVKYDAAGNVLWAHSAGGTFNDWSSGVTTDANGNVLVTGFFESPSINFGATVLTNTNSNYEMFIVKYDGAGNVLWAHSAGGGGNDDGRSIATDAGGNVLVTGVFGSPSITFGATVLTNAGVEDMFIVKYDGSGNVLWANSAGGTGSDAGFGVAIDAGGNVLVTGVFYSPSITFGTIVLTNAGILDMFIVKYDATGNVLWAHSAGGTGWEEGLGVATDVGGNVLVTGFFGSPSITFGTTVLTNTNAGFKDIFVVKYDPAGSVLWANSTGGIGWDEGRSVATDVGGNVLVTGFFADSITFGTTVLTGVSMDIFIVKYAPAGNVLWANSAGGIGGVMGTSIATDAGGNVLVTGDFSSSITFGTTVLTSAGSGDVFIAKLDNITGIAEENYSVEIVNIFPNPFSGSTTISFSLLQSQNISIKIFDVNGRLVAAVADKMFEAGENEIVWNAGEVNAGIYFLRMESASYSENRKLIVNK
jgi:hypothetical protein